MRPFVVLSREQVTELLEILDLYYKHEFQNHIPDDWFEHYRITRRNFESGLKKYRNRFNKFLAESEDPYYVLSDAEDVERLCRLLDILNNAISEFHNLLSLEDAGYYSTCITDLVYSLDLALYKALHENETMDIKEDDIF